MATTTEIVTLEGAYQAAHRDAIIVDRSDLGVLKFTGKTRLDLIHRMSTQALERLESGEGAATILTTDIARMVDRLLLYASSDSVYALTGENNAGAVARHLMGYVFFNDDFQVEDLSAETAVIAVYGARAAEMLRPLFGEAVDVPLHHWRQLTPDFSEQPVYLHRTDAIAGGGFLVLSDISVRDEVWEVLQGAGIVPAGEEAFDYLRIESGQPRFGREISLDYIPLEAGLWADVSFNKGCYIGQEIIARMESRGRLAKRLIRFRPEALVPAGATIEFGGRDAGVITSAANGPAGPLALGYVKSKVLQADEGQPLLAADVVLHPIEPERETV